MPIFRVKSVKIYTGQKNLHWRRRPRRRQLSGMHVSRKCIFFSKFSLTLYDIYCFANVFFLLKTSNFRVCKSWRRHLPSQGRPHWWWVSRLLWQLLLQKRGWPIKLNTWCLKPRNLIIVHFPPKTSIAYL